MANKKKAARSNRSAASASLARLEHALPGRFADYVGQLQSRLDRLEKQISAAQNAAMRQATRMLRDASRQLGQFEERGETAWQRLGARYRQEAAKLLRRLEETLAPLTRQQALSTPAKKKASRAKSASRKSVSRKKTASRAKAAAKKSTSTKAATRKSSKRKPARKSSKKRAGSRRRSSR